MEEDRLWLDHLRRDLPDHAAIIEAIGRGVARDERWRFFSVSCSLGRGNGDVFSDIDAGIGMFAELPVDELERDALALVASAGNLVDALVHHWPGLGQNDRRIAAEYRSGVQLDLTFTPASIRSGRLPDEEFAVIDKDHRLDDMPRARLAARAELLPEQCREWSFLGWWAVSDAAKYLQRASLFEAAARLEFIREQALRLFAASQGVRFPEFGLTSLLDYPPFELPLGLAHSYACPDDPQAVARAAGAAADLLERCATRASETIGIDLDTPMSATSRGRLEVAVTQFDP